MRDLDLKNQWALVESSGNFFCFTYLLFDIHFPSDA